MASTSRKRVRTRSRSLLVGRWLVLALLIVMTEATADAGPAHHRHFPAKNLVAYFEFDGLDAHSEAWKGTAVHAALVKTKSRNDT